MKSKRLNGIFLAVIATAMGQESLAVADEVASASASEPAADAPDRVYIKSVTAAGGGCNARNSTSEVSEDGKSFVIRFHRFLLHTERTSTLGTSSCNVALDLHVPAGQTVAVRTFGFEGYSSLEEGVAASASVSYGWTGRLGRVPQKSVLLEGPYEGPYRWLDDVDGRVAELDYKPCDGQGRLLELRMNLAMERSPQQSSSFILVPSIGGDLSADAAAEGELRFELAQRACDAP